jgi:hypothetical protein
VLQLDVDGIEVSKRAADLFDVTVGQATHALVSFAQEILVEIEYRYIECLA